MTNPVEEIVAVHTGTGAIDEWPYYHKADTDAEVIVKTRNISTGVFAVADDSAYSVVRNADNIGGVVTYPLSGAPLSSNYQIYITRDVAMIQPTSLRNAGGLWPRAVEAAIDNLSKQIQQLRRDSQKALYQVGWSPSGTELEIPDASYPDVLGWDVSGNLVNRELTVGAFVAYPPTEIISLEYFLRTLAPRAALIAAHEALFNEVTAVPMVLDCHGIEVQLDSPLLFRTTDLNFGASIQSAEKIIKDLSIKRITGAYSWQTRDYLYSIAGEAGIVDMRRVIFERPRFDVNSDDLVAMHVSGYYHCSINNPRIRGLTGTGIGILSSKYAINTGVGNPGGVTDNVNHGLAVIQPDIYGTFASTDGTIGIYTEDGDAEVKGGWLSWLSEGIVSARGGCNIDKVHFSMSDRANMTVAIRVDAPRNVSITDCEYDGCCVLFDNPTTNMFTEGVSYDQWNTVAHCGGKFSGTKTPGGATAGFGHINMKTRTAANFFKGLVIGAAEWAGDNIETVMWLTSGGGSWLGSSFNDILFAAPHSTSSIPGLTFPAGVKLRIARVGSAGAPQGLRMDAATAALEFQGTGSGSNIPFIRPNGKGFFIGRNESGVLVDYWEISDTGEHLKPVADNLRDIGDIDQRIHDFYLGRKMVLADSGTATAVAGAVTLNKLSGVITTEALTTAAAANYGLAITNSTIAATDIIFASVSEVTNSGGVPVVCKVQPGAGTLNIIIRNVHASAAFNGTLNIAFWALKVA
jgi:hypothetical protein